MAKSTSTSTSTSKGKAQEDTVKEQDEKPEADTAEAQPDATKEKATKAEKAEKAHKAEKPAPKSKSKSKSSAGRLRITQVRSGAGRLLKHRATLEALGLKRHQHSVVQNDNPAIRGMLFQVRHLVEVEELEGEE
jgi:large subunit ribosomal protein L30